MIQKLISIGDSSGDVVVVVVVIVHDFSCKTSHWFGVRAGGRACVCLCTRVYILIGLLYVCQLIVGIIFCRQQQMTIELLNTLSGWSGPFKIVIMNIAKKWSISSMRWKWFGAMLKLEAEKEDKLNWNALCIMYVCVRRCSTSFPFLTLFDFFKCIRWYWCDSFAEIASIPRN